jgi:hypothetical protein
LRWLEDDVIDMPAEMFTKDEPIAPKSVSPTETGAHLAQARPYRFPGVLNNPRFGLDCSRSLAWRSRHW